MKKKNMIGILIIVLVIVISIGIAYKLIEKSVTDRAKFDFTIDDNGSNETVSNDEHSFFGKVIESYESYIIVEPNEDEEERQSADKFSISLENNNTTYEVGTTVKITYVGMINESYPAQVGTTKIEIISGN